jgi:hypothetical protein
MNNGAAWLRMVRRGSVGSVSACWKAGPSSIRHRREVFPTEPMSDEEMERGLGECTVLYECDWMIVQYECYKKYKNKQKEWHAATKP